MDVSAMHAGGGTISRPISIVFALVAVAALAVCAGKARGGVDRPRALIAGLVVVFVFTAQLVSHEVLPGISVHFVGGALAALLLGPWIGALCMTTVLLLHCLVFGEGVGTVGLNVVNLVVLGTAGAYLLVAALLRGLPKNPDGLTATALIASIVSGAAATLGFLLQHALGGGDRPVSEIAGAVAGPQLLVGFGEGLITAIALVAAAQRRPGLVHVVSGPRRTAPQPRPRHPRRNPVPAPPAWDPAPDTMFRLVRRGHAGLR